LIVQSPTVQLEAADLAEVPVLDVIERDPRPGRCAHP
jgi:hypothetical protein